MQTEKTENAAICKVVLFFFTRFFVFDYVNVAAFFAPSRKKANVNVELVQNLSQKKNEKPGAFLAAKPSLGFFLVPTMYLIKYKKAGKEENNPKRTTLHMVAFFVFALRSLFSLWSFNKTGGYRKP